MLRAEAQNAKRDDFETEDEFLAAYDEYQDKKAVVREGRAKKGAAVTATTQVLQIIQRSKKGVDVPTLIKKTGLEDKQIRNIVFRAFKQGKIKRVGRGTYVAA